MVPGARVTYAQAAVQLGELLVEQKIGLVYGGGRTGLMGIVADAVLAKGGEVIGVIPKALMDKEVGHTGLSDLRIVHSMHERKAMMADLSDGFIALPGGFGTFEEICEAITWTQLGLQKKPCGFLSVDGFYDGLAEMFKHATNWQPSNHDKWLSKDER